MLLRKSQPFWGNFEQVRIFSCIQRVPITWPPEKLRGVLLSAMCVPDLRGTQGMCSFYTTRKGDEGEKIGGEVHHVTLSGGVVQADSGWSGATRCSTTAANFACPSP